MYLNVLFYYKPTRYREEKQATQKAFRAYLAAGIYEGADVNR